MENASKALIIAGAILLSIAIIGIGMYVYSQAEGIMKNINMSQQEITAYNAPFMNYEGSQKGATVKSLIGTVISHNAAYDDEEAAIYQITVNDKGDSADLEAIRGTLKSGSTYAVTFTYNQGLIKGITVTGSGLTSGSGSATNTVPDI